MDIKKPNYNKILRVIQHENVSLDIIKQFRNENINVKWTELIYKQTQDSILHITARLGQTDTVSYILKEWPPFDYVDIKNKDGKTALHEAAQFTQTNVIKILIEHGADVNCIKRADWTPLMLACTKSNSYETVECLLKNGAFVNLVNKDGWNSFHLACRIGDLDLIKLLLNYDNSVSNSYTHNNRTALQIASLHGHVKVVQLLLYISSTNVNHIDKCGNTVIHDAVCSGNIELVKLLVKNGANVSILNRAGLSCLHLAAGQCLIDMIKYLIMKLKMDPNIRGCSNITPLHCVARMKKYEAIDCLVRLGANWHISDEHGRTPNDYLKL